MSESSTVHLTEAVDTRYHTVESDFGKNGAKVVAQASRSASETTRPARGGLAVELLQAAPLPFPMKAPLRFADQAQMHYCAASDSRSSASRSIGTGFTK